MANNPVVTESFTFSHVWSLVKEKGLLKNCIKVRLNSSHSLCTLDRIKLLRGLGKKELVGNTKILLLSKFC